MWDSTGLTERETAIHWESKIFCILCHVRKGIAISDFENIYSLFIMLYYYSSVRHNRNFCYLDMACVTNYVLMEVQNIEATFGSAF